MEYNIKIKNAEGKNVTIGNVKRNKYGTLQVGVKACAETRDFLRNACAADDKWINLTLFEADGGPQQAEAKQPLGDAFHDDVIPF